MKTLEAACEYLERRKTLRNYNDDVAIILLV
jgi:hypothetical protein